LRNISGTDWSYYLIPFDASGVERPWNGKRVSSLVLDRLKAEPVTDVFLFSHGWRGDVSDAVQQYDAWVSAMAGSNADIAALKRARSGFQPLVVGVHWPSLPFGDEELRMVQGVAAGAANDWVEKEVDLFAGRLADTRRSRDALRTILVAAKSPPPGELPDNVARAFSTLQAESGMMARRSTTLPGMDCEPFDPRTLYGGIRSRAMRARASGQVQGADDLNWILQMLGYQSFWKMKDRARSFGESGAHQLLQSLQQAVPEGRQVRFHLMGHSFGCIVMSACVAGPSSRFDALPVSSLSLVQGALSLWAYCRDVELGINGQPTRSPAIPGYFRRIVDGKLVSGPIVTTQSVHDSAVGEMYPWAAWWKEQVVYATNAYPRYGAVGSFGIRGPGCDVVDIEIRRPDEGYRFEVGKIYNIECSRVICDGSGPSGAHSDNCKPEVAHAIWQAASFSAELQPAPQPPPRPVTPVVPKPRRRWRPFRH
jgi:hypothetical protein